MRASPLSGFRAIKRGSDCTGGKAGNGLQRAPPGAAMGRPGVSRDGQLAAPFVVACSGGDGPTAGTQGCAHAANAEHHQSPRGGFRRSRGVDGPNGSPSNGLVEGRISAENAAGVKDVRLAIQSQRNKRSGGVVASVKVTRIHAGQNNGRSSGNREASANEGVPRSGPAERRPSIERDRTGASVLNEDGEFIRITRRGSTDAPEECRVRRTIPWVRESIWVAARRWSQVIVSC